MVIIIHLLADSSCSDHPDLFPMGTCRSGSWFLLQQLLQPSPHGHYLGLPPYHCRGNRVPRNWNASGEGPLSLNYLLFSILNVKHSA